MIVKGTTPPPAWLRREWAASAASNDARLVRIMLQRGTASLPNEQYNMFKITRDRFDLQERRRQAFRVRIKCCDGLDRPLISCRFSSARVLTPPPPPPSSLLPSLWVQNANMTFHVDEDARKAALKEAAESRRGAQVPPEPPALYRLQRHPVVLAHTAAAHHRQLEGQEIPQEEGNRPPIQRIRERELMELPQPSAQSLQYPNLLNTNPEVTHSRPCSCEW